MSVPDHLIEKAAKALAAHDDWSVDDWDDWDDYDRYSYTRHARAALEAVADELRAEGARAERERIAAWIEQESQAPVYKADDIDVVIRSLGRVIRRGGGDTD